MRALAAGLCAALLLATGTARAFDVAITVDDMPVHGKLPPGVTRLALAEAHLRALEAFGVGQARGFVNLPGPPAARHST